MFCKNCGSEMNENAAVCVRCGVAKGSGNSYCPNCGKETNPNAAVCLSCGCSLVNSQVQSSIEDKDNIGWGVLGFFIPLIGLILYLVWRDSKPKAAKIAGKGALIGFVLGIVAYIFMLMMMFSL